MTHYATLGVTESVTPEELKRAYRKLASQHHPDKGGDTQRFQQIQTAYDVLSDPARRQQYDLERQGGGIRFNFHDGAGMGPDIDSIFRNFGFHFGQNPGGFGHFRQTQPRRNKDLRVAISISLESTLEPQTKTISVQTTNGQRQTVEVNIPRGIQNGSVMKYPDLGDNFFNTLPRGDLYVEFRVETHPVFRVHGRDLLLGVEINCFDAITGGETEIHSLDGKTFLLQIPAGTQSGTVMRIKEQGLYSTDRADRGNLLVEVVVRIPTNLSEEQLNLIQQIKSSQ